MVLCSIYYKIVIIICMIPILFSLPQVPGLQDEWAGLQETQRIRLIFTSILVR